MIVGRMSRSLPRPGSGTPRWSSDHLIHPDRKAIAADDRHGENRRQEHGEEEETSSSCRRAGISVPDISAAPLVGTTSPEGNDTLIHNLDKDNERAGNKEPGAGDLSNQDLLRTRLRSIGPAPTSQKPPAFQ